MYEPREDSFLLMKNLKEYIKKDYVVLDIGTGSGILAQEASIYAKKVVATDINKDIVKKLEKNNTNKKIKFIVSDLFSNISNEKFNLIVFNPPYLPSKNIKDRELDGGKSGLEIVKRFLKDARDHLKEKGKILLLCSSLNTNIEYFFSFYKYRFRKIDEQNFFFEKLFVYELK